MPESKAVDVLLSQILEKMETMEGHFQHAVQTHEQVFNMLRDFEQALEVLDTRTTEVENKVQGISPRPKQVNCVHCGRVLRTTSGICGVCKKPQ